MNRRRFLEFYRGEQWPRVIVDASQKGDKVLVASGKDAFIVRGVTG